MNMQMIALSPIIGGMDQLPVTELLTLSQAAELTDVTPSGLKQAILNGTLRAIKLGKVWFTTREAVEDWKLSAKHKPGPKKFRS